MQERFNQFLKVWPEARQRIPHALMQEMRITPELPAYKDIVQPVFLGIDRRPADDARGDSRLPRTAFAARSAAAGHHQEAARQARREKVKERPSTMTKRRKTLDEDEDLDDIGGDEEEIDLGLIPKVDLDDDIAET